ncbi:MAG: hypothetical protein ACRDO1_16805 [Nocardioidaceae bacterium]
MAAAFFTDNALVALTAGRAVAHRRPRVRRLALDLPGRAGA